MISLSMTTRERGVAASIWVCVNLREKEERLVISLGIITACMSGWGINVNYFSDHNKFRITSSLLICFVFYFVYVH